MIIGRRDDAPTAATFVHQLNSAVDLIVQDLSTTETSHFYFRILLALKCPLRKTNFGEDLHPSWASLEGGTLRTRTTMLGTPYWVDLDLGNGTAGLQDPGFELGEDVRTDARLLQDAEWSGAVADGRAHISHREATSQYAPRFLDSLSGFAVAECLMNLTLEPIKEEGGSSMNQFQLLRGKEFIVRNILEFAFPGHGPLVMASINRRKLAQSRGNKSETSEVKEESSSVLAPFRLCVRKRPVLSFEKLYENATEEDGVEEKPGGVENYVHLNYDAASTTTAPDSSITFHDGRLARNGKRLSMMHSTFQVDKVFGAEATNDLLTSSEVAPMLALANKGGNATLLCFGQTGTGKTYTLQSCLRYLISKLSAQIFTEPEGEESTGVSITFYEVFGKKCHDLMNGRKVVKLLADSNDVMHLRGANEISVNRASLTALGITSAEAAEEHISSILSEAIALRSSQETERNPVSSRSHAVCTINIRKGGDDTAAKAGSICLVDLAGSERNYETLKMSAADHLLSADINTALMSLKDCFRAAAAKAAGEKVTITPNNHFSVFNKGASQDPNRFKMRKNRPEPKIHNYQGMIPMVSKLDNADGHKDDAEASKENVERPRRAMATGKAKAAARVPYRAHLLTRVLKECFNPDGGMVTTVIATVSPSPTDLMHSLNTLNHVICMSSELEQLKSEVAVDIPIHTFFSPTAPVELWTAQHVQNWLASVDGGRFSMLQVPPDLDGKGLVSLEVSSLTALFAGTLRKARQGEEGNAWVVDNTAGDEETAKSSAIARALWGSIRREQESILRKRVIAENEFK